MSAAGVGLCGHAVTSHLAAVASAGKQADQVQGFDDNNERDDHGSGYEKTSSRPLESSALPVALIRVLAAVPSHEREREAGGGNDDQGVDVHANEHKQHGDLAGAGRGKLCANTFDDEHR